MEKCKIVPVSEYENSCLIHMRPAAECADVRIKDLEAELAIRDKQLDAAVKGLLYVRDECPTVHMAAMSARAALNLTESIKAKMRNEPPKEREKSVLDHLLDYSQDRVTLSRLGEILAVPTPVLRRVIVQAGQRMAGLDG